MFLYFNSRPSARGDSVGDAPQRYDSNFNSRPSARGDLPSSQAHFPLSYFNSRPSARGDPFVMPRSVTMPISIHAPPRGATFSICPSTHVSVFQFTPLREGRLRNTKSPDSQFYFNSRPSARGDSLRFSFPHATRVFQFTPLREGRRASGRVWGKAPNFNSRPSARGDLSRG